MVGAGASGGFVRMAGRDELPPGRAKEVEHRGRIYALFNVEGSIVAIDGICPHQGGPLAEGPVASGCVTCPWHGWQFDLRTGHSLWGSRVAQQVFEVRLDGDDVLVRVS